MNEHLAELLTIVKDNKDNKEFNSFFEENVSSRLTTIKESLR